MEKPPPLKEAFDLDLSDPVHLDTRPEHGWCFGRPPGIGPDRWPISPAFGTPLRHAFTLKLPAAYRTQGNDLVAVSLFIDEMFDTERMRRISAPLASVPKPRDPRRFDLEWWAYHLTLFWLTAEEFHGELGAPPTPGTTAEDGLPGWLVDPPADYFGKYTLPANAFHRPPDSGSAPGAYALQSLMQAEQPRSGWATLPAREALDHGFPIRISRREGDPNIGLPPREWPHENAASGYIPAYSEDPRAEDLERFAEFEAHLGGTMFPLQAYPAFSPFYLEFQETFGGFGFGGGIAQLDLAEMRISWAS